MQALEPFLDQRHLFYVLAVLVAAFLVLFGSRKIKADRARARLWRIEQTLARDGAKIRFRVAQRVREMKKDR